MGEERVERRPKFHYVKVPTDTWQKIVCNAKYRELFLETEETAQYKPGDVVIFLDKNNPYPRVVCVIDNSQHFAGFKEAWPHIPKHGLGYIGNEVDTAHYTDYEYEYPMRKIMEQGVRYICWHLVSAEYIKKVPKPQATNTIKASAVTQPAKEPKATELPAATDEPKVKEVEATSVKEQETMDSNQQAGAEPVQGEGQGQVEEPVSTTVAGHDTSESHEEQHEPTAMELAFKAAQAEAQEEVQVEAET